MQTATLGQLENFSREAGAAVADLGPHRRLITQGRERFELQQIPANPGFCFENATCFDRSTIADVADQVSPFQLRLLEQAVAHKGSIGFVYGPSRVSVVIGPPIEVREDDGKLVHSFSIASYVIPLPAGAMHD